MTEDPALQDQIVDARPIGFLLFTRFENEVWRAEVWLGPELIWSTDLAPVALLTPDNAMENAERIFAEHIKSVLTARAAS